MAEDNRSNDEFSHQTGLIGFFLRLFKRESLDHLPATYDGRERRHFTEGNRRSSEEDRRYYPPERRVKPNPQQEAPLHRQSPLVTCPECMTANTRTSRYCHQCGHSFELESRICLQCKTLIYPNANYCHHCGAKLNESE